MKEQSFARHSLDRNHSKCTEFVLGTNHRTQNSDIAPKKAQEIRGNFPRSKYKSDLVTPLSGCGLVAWRSLRATLNPKLRKVPGSIPGCPPCFCFFTTPCCMILFYFRQFLFANVFLFTTTNSSRNSRLRHTRQAQKIRKMCGVRFGRLSKRIKWLSVAFRGFPWLSLASLGPRDLATLLGLTQTPLWLQSNVSSHCTPNFECRGALSQPRKWVHPFFLSSPCFSPLIHCF